MAQAFDFAGTTTKWVPLDKNHGRWKRVVRHSSWYRQHREPKVWFESLQSLSQVLSDQNRDLLRLIIQTHPKSLNELAERSGRATSNLSRTLRTMERYGLVDLEEGPNRQLVPKVNYSGVALEVSFQS